MTKNEPVDRDLIDTYETVTVSCLPIAAQIRFHFPVFDNLEPPNDYLLPALLTEEQLLHALATPPLREGIRGSAENIKLFKKIELAQEKLRFQHQLILNWHDEMVTIHNDKNVMEDYQGVISQLATSTKNIIGLQNKLQEVKLRVRKLILKQQVLAVGQDREWVKYEEAFVDAIISQVDKSNIKLDRELKENVMKKRCTLGGILTKYKDRNFPIPEELADA